VLGLCQEPALPNGFNSGLVLWNLENARSLEKNWTTIMVNSAMKWGDDPAQFAPHNFTDFLKLMDQSVFYSICKENRSLCSLLPSGMQALGQQWYFVKESDPIFVVHYNAFSLDKVRVEAVLSSMTWKWIMHETDAFSTLPIPQLVAKVD
jgi:hypothetical protein